MDLLHIILKENGSFKDTDQVNKLKKEKPGTQPPLLTKEENSDSEYYQTNHEIRNWKEHTRIVKGIKWKSKKSKSL